MRMCHPQVEEVLAPLIKNGRVATCVMIDLEILYSARSPAHYRALRSFRRANYTNFPLTDRVCARAIEVQAELAELSHHRAAGAADLLIAACGELNGVAVLHYDRDFESIAAITGQLTTWVVPPGTVP